MDKPAMDEPKASQLGQLLAYGTPNCRLVVVEARRVLLAPSTRLTASYDERCMYSYDLVVTEAADDDAETALMRFTSIITLHPTLAPLIVLGHIRQGTVILVHASARRTVSNAKESRSAAMVSQLRINGFSVGAASVNAPAWLRNDALWHPFTGKADRPALTLRRTWLPTNAGDDAMALRPEWRSMAHVLGSAILIDGPPPDAISVDFEPRKKKKKRDGEAGREEEGEAVAEWPVHRLLPRTALVFVGSPAALPTGTPAGSTSVPPSLFATMERELMTSTAAVGLPKGRRGKTPADLLPHGSGASSAGAWALVGDGRTGAEGKGGAAAAAAAAARPTLTQLRWKMQLPLVGRLEAVGRIIHFGTPAREEPLPFQFQFRLRDNYGFSLAVVCWGGEAAKWHAALSALPVGRIIVVHGYRSRIFNGCYEAVLNWGNPNSEILLVDEDAEVPDDAHVAAAAEAAAAAAAAAVIAPLTGAVTAAKDAVEDLSVTPPIEPTASTPAEPVSSAPADPAAPAAVPAEGAAAVQAGDDAAPAIPQSCVFRTPVPDLYFTTLDELRSKSHGHGTSVAGIVARVGPITCSPILQATTHGAYDAAQATEDDALLAATHCGGDVRHLRSFVGQPGCELFGARLRNELRFSGLGRGPTQDALVYSRWVWLRDETAMFQIAVLLTSSSRWREFKGIRAGAALVITHCEVVASGPPAVQRSFYLRSTPVTSIAVGSPDTMTLRDETPALRWYARHWTTVRRVLQFRERWQSSWFRRTPIGMAFDDDGGAAVHKSSLSRPPTLSQYCDLLPSNVGLGGRVGPAPEALGFSSSEPDTLGLPRISVGQLLWLVSGMPHAMQALLVDGHEVGVLGHSERNGSPLAAGLAFEEEALEGNSPIITSPLATTRVCCTLVPGQALRVIVVGIVSHICRVYPEQDEGEQAAAAAAASAEAASRRKTAEDAAAAEAQRQREVAEKVAAAEREKAASAAAAAAAAGGAQQAGSGGVSVRVAGRPDVKLGTTEAAAARLLAALHKRRRASQRRPAGFAGSSALSDIDASSGTDAGGSRSEGAGRPAEEAHADGVIGTAAGAAPPSVAADPAVDSGGDVASDAQAARKKRSRSRREIDGLQPWWLVKTDMRREVHKAGGRLRLGGASSSAVGRQREADTGAGEESSGEEPAAAAAAAPPAAVASAADAALPVSAVSAEDEGPASAEIAAGALPSSAAAAATSSDAGAAETSPPKARDEAVPRLGGDEEEAEDPLPPSTAAELLAKALPPPQSQHARKRKVAATGAAAANPTDIANHKRWRALPRHERQRQLLALASEKQAFEEGDESPEQQRDREAGGVEPGAADDVRAALAAATQPLTFDDEVVAAADPTSYAAGRSASAAAGSRSFDRSGIFSGAPEVHVEDVVRGLHEVLNEAEDDDGGGGVAVPPAHIDAPVGSRPLYVLQLKEPPDELAAPGFAAYASAGASPAPRASINLLLHPSALLPHEPELPLSLLASGDPADGVAGQQQPDTALNLIRAFFPPTPALDRDAFAGYVSGRRFAFCLSVHQRSRDIPDVDVPSGLALPRPLDAQHCADPDGRRMPFVERVSARRATVRVEAVYEVAGPAEQAYPA